MDNYKPSRCYVHCDFNVFLCVRSKFHLSVKGNADCIGSTLQCCVIGPENTRHFLNQSYSKLEPNARLLLALSHALGCLHKLTLSCFVMIGHYTCFGFRCATPNRKGFSNTFDILCDRLFLWKKVFAWTAFSRYFPSLCSSCNAMYCCLPETEPQGRGSRSALGWTKQWWKQQWGRWSKSSMFLD